MDGVDNFALVGRCIKVCPPCSCTLNCLVAVVVVAGQAAAYRA